MGAQALPQTALAYIHQQPAFRREDAPGTGAMETHTQHHATISILITEAVMDKMDAPGMRAQELRQTAQTEVTKENQTMASALQQGVQTQGLHLISATERRTAAILMTVHKLTAELMDAPGMVAKEHQTAATATTQTSQDVQDKEDAHGQDVMEQSTPAVLTIQTSQGAQHRMDAHGRGV